MEVWRSDFKSPACKVRVAFWQPRISVERDSPMTRRPAKTSGLVSVRGEDAAELVPCSAEEP